MPKMKLSEYYVSSELPPKGHLDEIIGRAFARAIFASAWADAEQEAGRSLSGLEIMDVAPFDTHPDYAVALDTAEEALKHTTGASKIGLTEAYERNAAKPGHRTPPNPEDFGHYLGMEWLGRGVAWSDDHPPHGLHVGYGEFRVEPEKPEYTPYNTEIETWFERDRRHVELRDKRRGHTLLEFWDEDVTEMVEDGFLNPRDWHGSMLDYYNRYVAPGHEDKPKRNPRRRPGGRGPARGAGPRHNPRQVEADEDAARELSLYIEHSSEPCYRMYSAIARNLSIKKVRGRYDHHKAVRAFEHLAEFGAKAYAREFGDVSQPWHEMFNAPTRRLVATELRDLFESQHEAGEHDRYIPRRPYGPVTLRRR